MINNEKMGAYIKELRENFKMTQEELASKLYVSRQAISNWETGKNIPDIEKIKCLSEIFNVKIVDIYAGGKVKNQNEEDKVIALVIKHEHAKFIKSCLCCVAISLILMIIFLVYYFVNSYRTTKVFLVNNKNELFSATGYIVKSSNNVYFEVRTDLKNTDLKLLFKDKVIYETDDNVIRFKEVLGRNEYIITNSFNDFIENLTIIASIAEKDVSLKLDVISDYVNDDLFFFKEKPSTSNTSSNYSGNVPEQIKNKFVFKDDKYTLNIENDKIHILLVYIVDSNLFLVEENDNKFIKSYSYDVDTQILSFIKYDNKNNIIENEEYSINEDNAIANYFKNNYINKYLK